MRRMQEIEAVRYPTALSPGPAPLYHKLEQELRTRILSGEFKSGEVLPTEQRICSQYGVSRITVRRALETLIAEGLITRKRGVGTFYTPPQAAGIRSITLSGSLDEFLATRGVVEKDVLASCEAVAPEHVVRGLRLQSGGTVMRFDLLTVLDGLPIACSELYLPPAIGRKIDPADIQDRRLPIIRAIEQKLGFRVARAEQTLEADIARPIAAAQLGLEPMTPVLKTTRVYFDTAGTPIEMIISLMHPERYRYSMDFVARPRAV